MPGEWIKSKELGDFLKKKRENIRPEQVGLTTGIRRRTPGLRREEVACLAGIGVTWYTRLEQGKDIHVSQAIIESLSRVLLLEKEERNHLFILAGYQPPEEITPPSQKVGAVTRKILQSLTYSPAIIIDYRWNVIAWNDAAKLLLGDFEQMDDHQRNVVWSMFMDDKFHYMIEDWEKHAQNLVARFRINASTHVEDTWLQKLVEDLNQKNTAFRNMWGLHEIKGEEDLFKQINHPEMGRLNFEVGNYLLAENPELKMIVHMPNEATEDKIREYILCSK